VKTLLVATILLSCICVVTPTAVFAESVFDAAQARWLRTTAAGDDWRAPSASGDAARGVVSIGGAAEASAPSPGTAASSSLLLPGLGQYKLGHRLSATIYFGLEGIAWLAVGSYLWVGHARADSYRDYAVTFAGVQGTDHPDDYYGKLGDYMSSDGPAGYNESVRRDARDLYYPDVAAMDAYYESHRISGDDAWQWPSSGAYRRYRTLRDGSRFAYRVALYAAVGAAALRLVSAADAVRLARRDSAERQGGTVSLGFDAGPRGPSLYVQRSF
jgi:hypothetical protein